MTRHGGADAYEHMRQVRDDDDERRRRLRKTTTKDDDDDIANCRIQVYERSEFPEIQVDALEALTQFPDRQVQLKGLDYGFKEVLEMLIKLF